ncbi:MAG TPA: tetratricopeptide repeat protein [Blastocatellia bacterium]|nr:tetratricopeptide repeat protein [Blastocatellia bacterium]
MMICQAEVALPNWQPDRFWQQLSGALFLTLEEKRKIAGEIERMPADRLSELIETFDQQAVRFSSMLSAKIFQSLTGAIRAGRLADYTDIEGADAEALRQGDQSIRVIARLAKQDAAHESKLFNEVERILPGIRSPQIWLLWANRIKKLEGSRERLEWAYPRIKALGDHDAVTWNDFGNLLIEYLDRPDEAEAAYCRAIRLDPRFAYPWNNLGKLFKDHLKRFDEAEYAYRKAIELDPDYSTPWKGLGSLLQNQLNRDQEAEMAYRQALEIEPSNPHTWHELGNLLSDRLNQPEEAEVAYRKAVELSPNHSAFLNNLAWQLYLNHHALAEAEEYARRSIVPGPAYRINIHTLACILVKRDKWSEAVEYARDFIHRENDRLHERTWSEIILFFREIVAAGYTHEAVELLDETECGERWRPLREALRAISIDDSSYLLFVTPEVRQPAEEIITMLLPEGARLRHASRRGAMRRA